MTNAQDTQWLDEILNTLVTEVLFPSTKLDPKLPYVEKAKAAILAHEAESVAAAKVAVLEKILSAEDEPKNKAFAGTWHGNMAAACGEVARQYKLARKELAALQREQEGK